MPKLTLILYGTHAGHTWNLGHFVRVWGGQGPFWHFINLSDFEVVWVQGHFIAGVDF